MPPTLADESLSSPNSDLPVTSRPIHFGGFVPALRIRQNTPKLDMDLLPEIPGSGELGQELGRAWRENHPPVWHSDNGHPAWGHAIHGAITLIISGTGISAVLRTRPVGL